MSPFEGHFTTAVPGPWAASTAHTVTTYFGFLGFVQPTTPNGFVYAAIASGTTGSVEPTWPTVVGQVVTDGGVTWLCNSSLLIWELSVWDLIQSQSVNGDVGGTWAPASALVLSAASGGTLQVTGPTVVSDDGEIETQSGALYALAANDFPRLLPGHSGRSRRLVRSCLEGLSDQPYSLRQDFSIHALRAVACSLQLYSVASDDSAATATSYPVQWVMPLDVHDGATITQAVLSYQSFLGTPKGRVVAVATDGTVTPLTSPAFGADSNGYVSAPSGSGALLWVIPIDGGASAANAVANRATTSYFVEVVEDQTQAQFPGVLPVFAPVKFATTSPIDLANAPVLIDGNTTLPVSGDRVLIKNQVDSRQNGIYVYPALPYWTGSTPYAVGVFVVPTKPNGFFYTCTTAGTSSASPPTWPTTIGNTVTDGSATWTCWGAGTGTPFPFTGARPTITWSASTKYVTGALVQPNPGNGLFYKATTGGTSGTVQPTWPVTASATVNDGGVTWTAQGQILTTTFSPAVEMRTYGLPEGATVSVIAGVVNANTYWQYSGSGVGRTAVGATPAVPWVTIPSGLADAINDVPQDALGVFSAQGNGYFSVAVDHENITSRKFQ